MADLYRPPPDTRVSCSFYTKKPGPDGRGFTYQHVSLDGPTSDGYLLTLHPPVIGDLIVLVDRYETDTAGVWRVTGRQWLHNVYGSVNWPRGERQPFTGPALTLIVERAEGLFIDEVPDPEDPEDDTEKEA